MPEYDNTCFASPAPVASVTLTHACCYWTVRTYNNRHARGQPTL